MKETDGDLKFRQNIAMKISNSIIKVFLSYVSGGNGQILLLRFICTLTAISFQTETHLCFHSPLNKNGMFLLFIDITKKNVCEREISFKYF